MQGPGDIIEDFFESAFGGEAIVYRAYGTVRINERWGDETIVFLIESTPVAAVDENDYGCVSLFCWEIVDCLKRVIPVGNIKLARQGFDGFCAERVVFVEILLEIGVARS